MSRYFVNGLGINNAVGGSVAEVYRSIFVEAKPPVENQAALISGRSTPARYVTLDLPEIPAALKARFDSRSNRLLLHAVEQIRPVISRLIEKYGRDRVAVILGTSTSGVLETEQSFIDEPDIPRGPDFNYYKQEISNPGDFLAAYLGLTGLRYTVSTACTSSAKAFIEAQRLMESGFCDATIVGGVDALSSLTLDGFDSLDSVSPHVTNPFSKERKGINIGEGAALFVLSKEESEIEFLGYGESSDAYHPSSPDPEGIGAELALRGALKRAGVKESDVAYVNLHGTGTEKNDFMEGRVTHRIFGSDVPVSSTKPFIGHTLGAAGAQEAALCYMALSPLNERRLLPPHVWDGEQDSEIPVLHFVRPGEAMRGGVMMSNSFAFGGNNVSLIFAKSKR